MIIECYQDSSTRSVLEFVHFVLFKVVISNLYAQVKNEARKSAEENNYLG